ncbi:MAG: hypothetical protein M1119_00025 [Firmicutes bacterium]|nr:hypothetical protein [Bacillota bacterium]
MNNHYRRYDFGELIHIIEQNHLSIERSTYFNFFLLPLVWAVRKLGKTISRFLQKRTDFELGSGGLNQVDHRATNDLDTHTLPEEHGGCHNKRPEP